MKTSIANVAGFIALATASLVFADDKQAMIESAKTAGPSTVTANATIKAPDGTLLVEGSNSFTCYPQQKNIGPMCNQPGWDELIKAMSNKQDFQPKQFSMSYMLAGEGTALGVSNSDPYISDPSQTDDWVKEGPHLMIIVPNRETLEGLSRDPNDPVYVMWGDTPYAHIMVKMGDE